jgi:hypothetical protein
MISARGITARSRARQARQAGRRVQAMTVGTMAAWFWKGAHEGGGMQRMKIKVKKVEPIRATQLKPDS